MLKRLLGEPLVQFLLIGVGLFLAYGLLNRGAPAADPSAIIVTESDVARLKQSFEGVWRRPPNAQEIDALIDDFVLEEVLVREATLLGLDQNDTVIRRRLRQKMDFLMQAAGNAMEPSDEDLAAFYAENAARFTPPPRIAFEQVYLGEAPDKDDVERARDALRAGAEPVAVGQQSLLPPGMDASPQQAIDGQFGMGMFEQLAELPMGEWSGPVESGFGTHLVRVVEKAEANPPALENVRDRVVEAWRSDQIEALTSRQYEALVDGYTIVLLDERPS